MLVVLISLQLFCSNAHSKTPICTGKSILMWSSCVGTQIVKGEYIYRGEYQEGKKHGYGVYIVISPQHKGNKYVGEFRFDAKEGVGTYTYANGDVYVGNFRANKRNGKGIFTSRNGDKYEGEYKEDKRDGFGTYVKNTGETYLGYWSDDLFIETKQQADARTEVTEKSKSIKKQDSAKTISEEVPNVVVRSPEAKREKKERVDAPPIAISIDVSKPDINGMVTLDISTGVDTSSLIINGREEGGRENGQYKLTRIARVGQTTNFHIVATDIYGKTTDKSVSVYREIPIEKVELTLNPEKLKVKKIDDAVALIIGVDNYKSLPNSEYSSNDAKLFFEYARNSLGVRTDRIKILIDERATNIEVLKALKVWLPQNVNRDTTTVYIFFSGHGSPSLTGDEFYFLPFDADADFLEKTAIRQSEMFQYILDLAPRKTIVFIDSCFSGHSKSGGLLASNSRPLALKKTEFARINNINILAASKTDEISYSSKDLKHGLFSYHLMKGLEGSADLNNDQQVSLGELYEYLSIAVPKFAITMSKTQTPQLFGDSSIIILDR